MQSYEELALALMHTLDNGRKRPPEISTAMRGEMAVLRLLKHSGAPMSAGQISRTLGMTTSRIAAVLGSLEKKGMLLRTDDPGDKRRVLVTLTQQGSDFCQMRRQEALQHMTQMLEHLGETDAAHFVRIVGRIHEWMPAHPSGLNRKEEPADE